MDWNSVSQYLNLGLQCIILDPVYSYILDCHKDIMGFFALKEGKKKDKEDK